MTTAPDSLEVSSEQLRQELVEIKERLGALESVDGLVYQDVIADHLRTVVGDKAGRKAIMRLCASPKTREELATTLSKKSHQALDHHLNPLRDDPSILHMGRNEEGVQTFEWSYVVKRLSPVKRNAVIGE